MELLVTKHLVNALKLQLVNILIGSFEYCMERNAFLQPKWCSYIKFGDTDMIHQTAKLKPPSNIPCIQ